MHIETGEIIEADKLKQLTPRERAKYVAVKRDLSRLEIANKQIRLYSPCGCGSEKKFKFCCYKR